MYGFGRPYVILACACEVTITCDRAKCDDTDRQQVRRHFGNQHIFTGTAGLEVGISHILSITA